MGPLFHTCSPSPGRSGSVCAQVGFVFAGVRLVQARPSFPPLRLSWCSSVGLRFFFSLAFSGFAVPGKVCWCWCSLLVPPLLFCVPRLGFLLSNFHFIFIFISCSSPFSSSFSLHSPDLSFCPRLAGCVCVEHLNRCKTSFGVLVSRGAVVHSAVTA